jgi:hypothetical protein
MSERIMDGPVFLPEIGEYEIRNNGEVIGYASTLGKATDMYHTALRCHREHVTRNPANREEIPFDGSYPECDSVTGPQDIGLVAGVDF